MTKEEKVQEILKRLYKKYPNPKTALNWEFPLQLLIATILSAQTTDVLVNKVTPELFKRFKKASDFAEASVEEIGEYINKVNYHRNKAKNIKLACRIIAEKYNGKVPETMEELDALPGVARKTANVVLGDAFNKPVGVVVDTHVMRLSRKLELTNHLDPVKIERDLMAIVPKNDWINFSHLLIFHGRETCPARPHKCIDCPLKELCPEYEGK